MKAALALLGIACVAATVASVGATLVGCATAVEDTGTVTLHDAGHGGDTAHPVDGADETASSTDSGSTSRDSTTTSLDTGATPADSSSTDSSSDSSSTDDSAIEIDSATTTDSGSTLDTSPPPTDATSGCSKDSDCTFPYNCCDLTKHKCSVFIGPICVP